MTFCKADATSLADVEHALKCAKDIAEQNDAKVHGAANCVGSVLLKAAHQTSDEDFHDIMRTNASSAFYVTRTFAKHLMGKGGGSIALCGYQYPTQLRLFEGLCCLNLENHLLG